MIYMDNAATTTVRKEVVEAMMPYFSDKFGNPSSLYELAVENKNVINEARRTIADTIGAKEEEIFFTSGGTEADNWALRTVAENYSDKGKYIITSKIEHHAILHTCEYLEKKGFEITYVNVDEYGIIKMNELHNAIRKDTILISVMFANNEIGTIQPIGEIGRIAKGAGVLFHTDAVQAYCHVPINVKDLGIDLLSASGHKIRGPKGVGFLYVRDGVKISPMIFGGAQEKKMRAGTENVPGIVGLSKAAQMESSELIQIAYKERKARDYLIERMIREIPFTRLNGHRFNRLPGNASFSFQFVDGESLLVMLDMEGICASGGSACTSELREPSHVLKASGLPDDVAYGTLRLTISRDTTRGEIDKVVNAVKRIVFELRSKSEEYNNLVRKNRRYWINNRR